MFFSTFFWDVIFVCFKLRMGMEDFCLTQLFGAVEWLWSFCWRSEEWSNYQGDESEAQLHKRCV